MSKQAVMPLVRYSRIETLLRRYWSSGAILASIVKRQSVGEASGKAHGRMGVGILEARQKEISFAVDGLLVLARRGLRSDIGDVVVFDHELAGKNIFVVS